MAEGGGESRQHFADLLAQPASRSLHRILTIALDFSSFGGNGTGMRRKSLLRINDCQRRVDDALVRSSACRPWHGKEYERRYVRTPSLDGAGHGSCCSYLVGRVSSSDCRQTLRQLRTRSSRTSPTRRCVVCKLVRPCCERSSSLQRAVRSPSIAFVALSVTPVCRTRLVCSSSAHWRAAVQSQRVDPPLPIPTPPAAPEVVGLWSSRFDVALARVARVGAPAGAAFGEDAGEEVGAGFGRRVGGAPIGGQLAGDGGLEQALRQVSRSRRAAPAPLPRRQSQ